MAKPKPRWLTLVSSVFRAVAVVSRAAPRPLAVLTLIRLIGGAGPAAVLYLQKVIIDRLVPVTGDANDSMLAFYTDVGIAFVLVVIAFVVVNVLLDSMETVAGFQSVAFRDTVQGNIKARLLDKVGHFDDLALFESPKLLDTLQRALNGIGRLNQLAFTIGNLMTGAFAIVPIVLLCYSIAWWIPLILILTAVPSIYVQVRYEERAWGIEHSQAGSLRERSLYERMITGREFAKEVRLYGLADFLLTGWRGLFWRAFNEMQAVRARGMRVIVGWSLLSGLGVAVTFVYIVYAVGTGQFTIGDLALFVGIVFQARQSIYVLIANGGDLHQGMMGTEPIFELLALEPSVAERTMSINGPSTPGIHIQNVEFAYPGTDKTVLRDINLLIAPGETIALVGENGAGKTTLTKLLCRLYDPGEGRIRWDGKDLRTFEPAELRGCVAAVFQDHARFPVSFRHNVTFGDLGATDDGERLERILTAPGLAFDLDSLPSGVDTPLTREVQGGGELSGGQWQRVAIMRALFKDPKTELLILDEPTASLDPNSEDEIYSVFEEMAKEKMTIIITHRLALSRMADRVVVLHEGRMEEVGTHAELMRLRGRYFDMFNRQARRYLEPGRGATKS